MWLSADRQLFSAISGHAVIQHIPAPIFYSEKVLAAAELFCRWLVLSTSVLLLHNFMLNLSITLLSYDRYKKPYRI